MYLISVFTCCLFRLAGGRAELCYVNHVRLPTLTGGVAEQRGTGGVRFHLPLSLSLPPPDAWRVIDSWPDAIGPGRDSLRLKTSGDTGDKCVSNLRQRSRLSSQGRIANDLTDKTVIFKSYLVLARGLERSQTVAQGNARLSPLGFCSWTEATELLPASHGGVAGHRYGRRGGGCVCRLWERPATVG